MSNDPSKDNIGLSSYIPRELRAGEDEVPDTYERGAISVFGLGPSRLDLEHSRAASEVKKYAPQSDRLHNGVVIVARRLFMQNQPVNAENVIREWDTTNTVLPDIGFVRAYMETEEFKRKLDTIGGRNIPGGLTHAQEAFITTLTYPDGKPLHMKMKKHKIPWVTFQGWLKQPKFLEHLMLSAEQALDASQAFALIQLVQQAAGGNSKAMDTVLAMTGRWDPTNRKQVDAQKMVGIILQVLDEEISDPELKSRIGNRLSILSAATAESPSHTVSGELG
jgi:hypothetical protein